MKTIKTVLINLVILAVCSYLAWASFRIGFRNVEKVKTLAAETFDKSGFEIVGYEGYLWGPFTGGHVWYIIKRKNNDSILYNTYLALWGDEVHIYSLKAINAIQP